jgi:hypothetical protein
MFWIDDTWMQQVLCLLAFIPEVIFCQSKDCFPDVTWPGSVMKAGCDIGYPDQLILGPCTPLTSTNCSVSRARAPRMTLVFDLSLARSNLPNCVLIMHWFRCPVNVARRALLFVHGPVAQARARTWVIIHFRMGMYGLPIDAGLPAICIFLT